MPSRSVTNRPRRGDKVWVRERYDRGLQPNGYIKHLDWTDGYPPTFIVMFYPKTGNLQHDTNAHTMTESFELHEFEATFDSSFGGTWCIGGKHPLIEAKSSESQTETETGEDDERLVEWKD